MVTLGDYEGSLPTWCPGCGNFGILEALKKALVNMGKAPHEILVISGIGQAGKTPQYLKGNGFNALHGRALPLATGAKLANHELPVIVCGGDGDGYAEGGNHLLHAARRNIDLTYIVHNNQIYGLTKGQPSPTTDAGTESKISPQGSATPLNPLGVALAAGCSFLARSFAGDQDHLASMIEAGMRHRGFALIDVLQPCVSFNHVNTFGWYKERIYKLAETDHRSDDKLAAFQKTQEWGDRIPIGVIFEEKRPLFEDEFPALLHQVPLVRQSVEPQRIGTLLTTFV
jgi:2-oxoglutarate ferredoxin oxidoreductase subunit beta